MLYGVKQCMERLFHPLIILQQLLVKMNCESPALITHPAFGICMRYELLIAASKRKNFGSSSASKYELNQSSTRCYSNCEAPKKSIQTSLQKHIVYDIIWNMHGLWFSNAIVLEAPACPERLLVVAWILSYECAGRLKCMGYELLISPIRSKQKNKPSLQM